ncbi:hypothetical protein FACS1894110_09960 [Spirochaetia bacterium]|nr:hypothetical protein FACS1894110_09960 [Spirochaetia bacterium]
MICREFTLDPDAAGASYFGPAAQCLAFDPGGPNPLYLGQTSDIANFPPPPAVDSGYFIDNLLTGKEADYLPADYPPIVNTYVDNGYLHIVYEDSEIVLSAVVDGSGDLIIDYDDFELANIHVDGDGNLIYDYIGGRWRDSGRDIGTTPHVFPKVTEGNQISRSFVTFHPEPGVVPPGSNQVLMPLEKISNIGALYQGWTFEGWYIDPELTIPWDFDNVVSSENIDLWAKWGIAPFDIFYILNGGVNNPGNPAQYTIYDTVTLLEPTRENYTFGGWYDNPGFKGNPVLAIAAGTAEEVYLYARWMSAENEAVEAVADIFQGDSMISITPNGSDFAERGKG